MWINKEKCAKGMKIDLGAGDPNNGEIQATGYVLQDIEAHQGIDLVCDILDITTHVENNFCSVVRLSHVLEHFGKKQGKKVVTDIFNILQPGGLFEVFVPSFRWHASLLFSGKEEDAVLYAYGGQKDEFDYHKTGFTPNNLRSLLEDVGFENITIQEATSLTATACKPV